MKKNKKIIVAAVAGSALMMLVQFSLNTDDLAARSSDTHEGEHGGGGHDEHKGHGEEKVVRLSRDKLKEFDITIGKVGSGKLKIQTNLPGEVKLNADRSVHVVPQVSGVVREFRKKLGDKVKAGEIIAILDSREIGETAIEYLNARTEVEAAKAELANMTAKVELAKINLNIMEENLSWREKVFTNTKALLKRLKDKPSLDDIALEFKDKPIGKNRAKLLRSYAGLIYSRYAIKREETLRKEKVTSETEYQEAARDYSAAKSEFEAVVEEVGFDNHLELMQARQKEALAKQEVKVAGLEAEIAKQKLDAVKSALRSDKRKLHILGLHEKDIKRLEDELVKDSEIARYFIRASIDGTVIKKHIAPGERLNEDSEIYEISDLSTVWVDLDAYRKDLPFIREKQRVLISTGHGIPDIEGKIMYVEPLVGEETRTALVRVVLPNREGHWRPGMFVTAKVTVDELAVSLLVPKTALHTIDNQAVVFVKKEEGFVPQPVTVGASDSTHVEILSGLSAGQRYVKKGGFAIKAELAKGSFASGHSH